MVVNSADYATVILLNHTSIVVQHKSMFLIVTKL